jgi:hypothetical protein
VSSKSFPFMLRNKKIHVDNVQLFLKFKHEEDDNEEYRQKCQGNDKILQISLTPLNGTNNTNGNAAATDSGSGSMESVKSFLGGTPHANINIQSPQVVVPLTLKITSTMAWPVVQINNIEDLIIVCQYSGL